MRSSTRGARDLRGHRRRGGTHDRAEPPPQGRPSGVPPRGRRLVREDGDVRLCARRDGPAPPQEGGVWGGGLAGGPPRAYPARATRLDRRGPVPPRSRPDAGTPRQAVEPHGLHELRGHGGSWHTGRLRLRPQLRGGGVLRARDHEVGDGASVETLPDGGGGTPVLAGAAQG